MSDETEKTTGGETEVAAHAKDTLPPVSEDEKLSDAELSAKRGLSHRDGPADARSAREVIAGVARKAREAAAAAKGAKAT